jgi:hypothetical protein
MIVNLSKVSTADYDPIKDEYRLRYSVNGVYATLSGQCVRACKTFQQIQNLVSLVEHELIKRALI